VLFTKVNFVSLLALHYYTGIGVAKIETYKTANLKKRKQDTRLLATYMAG